MVKQHLILLITIILLAVSAQAEDKRANQGRIKLAGLVVNTAADPLPGVRIDIIGTKLSATTDSRGFFLFTKAPDGKVVLRLSKDGFATITRQAEVKGDALMPESMTVEMAAEGTTSTKEILSGKGTAYIAYIKPPETEPNAKGTWLQEAWLLPMLQYSDPLELVTHNDDPKRPQNPISTDGNQVMLYPSDAPERSTYFRLRGPVYHLTFDGGGRYLFLAGSMRDSAIRVYDETDNHEIAGRIPLPQTGAITSLNRSKDGKWILASVMSATSGIFVANPLTLQAEAFLPLDNLGNAVPLYVTSGAPGQLLVTVGAPAQPGKLLIVDAYTGATITEIPVGQVPTCVTTTPDNRFAYVVNSQSGNLTVVDLNQQRAIGVLPVGVSPQQAAVTPDGKLLIVSNRGSDTVSFVDTTSHRTTGFARVGSAPYSIAVTPDGKSAFVTNMGSRNVSTVDLETRKEVYETNSLPHAIPFDIELRP